MYLNLFSPSVTAAAVPPSRLPPRSVLLLCRGVHRTPAPSSEGGKAAIARNTKKTRFFKQVVSAAKQTDTFIGAFTVYNLAGVTAPCLKILFEVIIPHTAAEVKSYCLYFLPRAAANKFLKY